MSRILTSTLSIAVVSVSVIHLLVAILARIFTARVPGEADHPEVVEALGLYRRPVASCTRPAAQSPVATWGDNRGPRIAGAPRKTRTLRQKQRTQVGHQRGGGAPLGGGSPPGKPLGVWSMFSLSWFHACLATRPSEAAHPQMCFEKADSWIFCMAHGCR